MFKPFNLNLNAHDSFIKINYSNFKIEVHIKSRKQICANNKMGA